jgi:uncharacterized RDD family membrane protein YckC
MKPTLKTLPALLLLAASLPLTALRADNPNPSPTPTPAAETPLHEIGATPTPAAKAADGSWLVGVGTAATNAAAPAGAAPTPTPLPPVTHVPRHGHDQDDFNRVAIDEESYVAPGETIPGNAVAIFGPLTIDGTVDGNAVSVMGSGRIDGTVHGNAVVVMGTLRLGPNAHIDGNAVAAGGVLVKEPGAYVGGNTVPVGPGFNMNQDSGAVSWWQHGLRRGRPLAFGPHLHVIWFFSLGLLLVYAVLAMAFPTGIRKCGETLAQRPGLTILSGILGIIALPIVFILLLCTVVGIPIALLVLPLGIITAIMFGKAALYSLVGRAIVKQPLHPAVPVLIGGLLFVLVYLVPYLGLMVWFIVAFLGFACAVATLLSPVRPVPPAVATPVVPAPVSPAATPVIVLPAAAAPASTLAEPMAAEAVPAPVPPPAAAAPVPPVIPAALTYASEAALPRAGFWVRIAALLIDSILVAIVCQGHDIFPFALAAYAALMWKFKGATLGDIIFHLKVVRIDARPLDWPTALVRALGCFISIVVIGLGFIWIAFDPEKQGWHDKIAGTVVVRVPKSVPLV